MVFAAIAVAALLVESVLVVRTLSADHESAGADVRVERLVPPRSLPSRGMLVSSRVRADGSVAVTQWIRSPQGIDQVTILAPGSTGAPGSPRVANVRLVGDGGAVLADGIAVGSSPRQVRLDRPTSVLQVTYVLDGVAERSSTVPGRLLVQALATGLVTNARSGPTIVTAEAPVGAEVLNLACSDARSSVELLRPCGNPDGTGWQVRLSPTASVGRVVAQVDLG